MNNGVTQAGGPAKWHAALSRGSDACQIDLLETTTLGADKGGDVRESVQDLHKVQVTPHVAQNKSGAPLNGA